MKPKGTKARAVDDELTPDELEKLTERDRARVALAVARWADGPEAEEDGLPATAAEALTADDIRALGSPAGLELGECLARAARLGIVRDVREQKLYRKAVQPGGKPHTFDTYCRVFLGKSSNAVEEELATLEQLGERMFAAAKFAGLTRGDFRQLRALPADDLPRLAADGESLVLGERVIPMDDRAQVAEVFAGVLATERADRKAAESARQASDEKLQNAIRKLDELQSRIAEGENDNERLRALNASLDVLRGQLVTEQDVDPLAFRLMQVTTHLGGIVQEAEETMADPQILRGFLRPLQVVFSRLIRLAGGMHEDAAAAPPTSGEALDYAAANAAVPLEDEEDA
jgi:hypothetical protein